MPGSAIVAIDGFNLQVGKSSSLKSFQHAKGLAYNVASCHVVYFSFPIPLSASLNKYTVSIFTQNQVLPKY